MDRLCGASWTGSWIYEGDLHPCVQSLILNDVPPALMTLGGIVLIAHIQERPTQLRWIEITPRLPIVFSLILIVLAFINLIKYAVDDGAPYEIIQAALSTNGWVLALMSLCLSRRSVLPLHLLVRLFWAFDCLTLLKSVESSVSLLRRGIEFDDTMLLYFLRLPFQIVMVYYAVSWRSRGYDDDAYEQRASEEATALRGAPLTHSLSSPDFGAGEDVEAQSSATRSPPTMWTRIRNLAGTGPAYSKVDNSKPFDRMFTEDCSLQDVVTIDSSSFVRQKSPFPRGADLSPSEAPNHSAHPLFGCHVTVPSFNEQTVLNRSVVQYCVRIHIRSKAFASGDEAVDSAVVWKKWQEIEGLNDMLVQTREKFDLMSQMPKLTPPARGPYANPELVRTNLERYFRQVLEEPAFWDDLSGFMQLAAKIGHMKQHAAILRAEAERKVSSPVSASSPPPPMSASPPPERGRLSASPPPSSSSLRAPSSTKSDFNLIGVSVTAWMKWAAEPEIKSPSSKPHFYATFEVHVRTTRTEWNAHKKLSEIQRLRSELVKRFPAFPIPSLSIDKGFEKDEASLSQARTALEIFLQAVCSTSYFECPELAACLAEQEHHSKRVTKDRMVACSDPSLMPPPEVTTSPTPTTTKSENVPMPGTTRRADSVGVASSLGDQTSSSLSQSINTAADSYFSASTVATSPIPVATGSAVSSRPPPAARSASASLARHSYSASMPRHQSVIGGSSYLDGGDAFASDSDVDEEEDLAEQERSSGMQGIAEHDVVTSAETSGQLTQVAVVGKRPEGNHRFTVNIPEWSFVGDKSKKHVMFRIVVRQFFALDSYQEWSVRRRFAQFDAMHQSLKAKFSSVDFPSLPPKTLNKKPSMAFLDSRQQLLEIYLASIINTTHFQCDEFFSFFDMNNSRREITMGTL